MVKIRKVTIKDIAKKTNLSITTVSLIMNNKANHIPNKTQDLVLKTAKAMRYRPNQIAVTMKTKKTNSIGLVIPDIENPFFSSIVKQVNKYALSEGYRLLTIETQDQNDFLTHGIYPLIDQQVDGVIISNSTFSTDHGGEELKSMFDDYRIPLVSIDSDYKGIESVIVDHEEGGYQATKYLLSRGHKLIGCYTGPKHNKTSEQRVSGYIRALKEAGIEVNHDYFFEGNYKMNSIDGSLKHFIELGVTSVFCLNDMMAYGLYRQAYVEGIRIPDDLSVVGFDDIYVSSIVSPSLTTVRQPVEDIAERAVQILIKMMNNKVAKLVENVNLNTSLVIRDSVKEVI